MEKFKNYLEILISIAVVIFIIYIGPSVIDVFLHAYNEGRYTAVIVGSIICILTLFGFIDYCHKEVRDWFILLLIVGFIYVLYVISSSFFDPISINTKINILIAFVFWYAYITENKIKFLTNHIDALQRKNDGDL